MGCFNVDDLFSIIRERTPYLNFVNTIKSASSIKTYSRCLAGYIKFRQSEILENLLAENSRSIEASIMSYLVRLKMSKAFLMPPEIQYFHPSSISIG